MKVINVKVKSSDDAEVVEGILTLEKKVGDTWTKVDSWNVLSGTEEASRQFLLEDDMRVTVEGLSDLVDVLDKDQFVVVKRPRSDGFKAELAAQEAEKKATAEGEAKEGAAMAAQTVPPMPPKAPSGPPPGAMGPAPPSQPPPKSGIQTTTTTTTTPIGGGA